MSYLNLKAYLNKDFLILGQSTHYAFSQPPTVKANKYFHSIARCLEAGTVADLDPAACAAASRMVPHPERIICLNGAVDETVSASIVAQLLFLEADAPEKPINLYINTPGGSVTAGLAIYDTMTYIASPVTTICVGQAASMGSLLLCGGAAKKRYALPHSSVMVHQPSGGYFGQASDIAIHAKEILRVREQLNGIYKRHLTKPHTLEEIERLMERDKFMGAEEALEIGIVDEILDRRVKDEVEGEKDKEKP
ncbi:hypothetical protein MMC20_007376 [Loxospora ochrophaea]|nr:hypothetical protein [Loxospora ochrophaea]